MGDNGQEGKAMDLGGHLLLTVEEVAGLMRMAPKTIYNSVMRQSKKKDPFPIPVKRIGRLIRFRAEDVKKWLESP